MPDPLHQNHDPILRNRRERRLAWMFFAALLLFVGLAWFVGEKTGSSRGSVTPIETTRP